MLTLRGMGMDVSAVGIAIGQHTGLGLLSYHVAQAERLWLGELGIIGGEDNIYGAIGGGLAHRPQIPLLPLLA